MFHATMKHGLYEIFSKPRMRFVWLQGECGMDAGLDSSNEGRKFKEEVHWI